MTVFRDREIVTPRFVPERLKHREATLARLRSMLGGVVTSPCDCNLRTVQLIGPSGTGKTSCIQIVGKAIEEQARAERIDLRHVYVNLKLHGGSRVLLYRYLVESIAPQIHSLGMGAEELLWNLVKHLREKRKFLLLSFDELDYWLRSTKDTSLVYDLTRLNEMDGAENRSPVLGVVFAARSTSFHRRLDPAELSTLGRIPIEFRAYSEDEIFDILMERVPLAFERGAVSNEVVRYVAKIGSSPPANGDARYAIDLLHYAGDLADNQQAGVVTVDHVRLLVGQLHPAVTEDDIMSLPKTEHVLSLMAVVMSLRGKSSKAYSSLKEVREEAEVLERTRNAEGLVSDLEDLLQDLSDRGILEIRSLREIGINGVPIDKLQAFLEVLFKRLETGLGN